MKRVLFGVVIMALLAGAAFADLANPSFEMGLTDWSYTADYVDAVTSYSQTDGGDGPLTWLAQDGSSFALLKANKPKTELHQTFQATSNGPLTLAYFFDAGDAIRRDPVTHLFTSGNDTAIGTLSGGAYSNYTLFSTSVSDVGDYAGTPWTYVHTPDLTAGVSYTLYFEVSNQPPTDFKAPSYLGVDVVPVPGAVLLGFLGLSAAGLGLRKLA